MTPPASPVDNSLMVGSVAESTQHVTLPGIVTVTRSRALRAPRCALVAAAVLVLSDGYWGGILKDLVVQLVAGQ